jgi:hypothetical protein
MFRAVIFAAVSTTRQAAKDKFSLPNQLEQCHGAMASHGWTEAHEPLVVPGHSRTALVSLSDAQEVIPAIKKLLQLAEKQTINLVLCADVNRYRVLMQQIEYTLAAYGCQMYSVAQPVDPLPPDVFLQQKNDAATIVHSVSALVSNLQISDLGRKYRFGMAKRIDELGLHYASSMYGYVKPENERYNTKAILVQEPSECEHILFMKRAYEEGASGLEIAQKLNEMKAPTRAGGKWYSETVLNIITHPFYAGLVVRNKAKHKRNPITGKTVRKKLPRDKWILAPGKHQPLWAPEDYERLCDLRFKRSGRLMGKTQRTHYFSHLLHCKKCKRVLTAFDPEARRHKRMAPDFPYKCPNGYQHDGHVRIKENTIKEGLRQALEEALQAAEVAPADPKAKSRAAKTIVVSEKALKDIEESRARYQRAYGKGLLTDRDLEKRMAELDADKRRHEHELDQVRDQDASRAKRLKNIVDVRALLDRLDDVWEMPPEKANALLSSLIETIVVDNNRIRSLVFRL